MAETILYVPQLVAFYRRHRGTVRRSAMI